MIIGYDKKKNNNKSQHFLHIIRKQPIKYNEHLLYFYQKLDLYNDSLVSHYIIFQIENYT